MCTTSSPSKWICSWVMLKLILRLLLKCGHSRSSTLTIWRWSLSCRTPPCSVKKKFKTKFHFNRKNLDRRAKRKPHRLLSRFSKWNGFLNTKTWLSSTGICQRKIQTSSQMIWSLPFCSSRTLRTCFTSCLLFTWSLCRQVCSTFRITYSMNQRASGMDPLQASAEL